MATVGPTSGVIKVLVSFYRFNDDKSAFERHRSRLPVDLAKHGNLTTFKRHLIDFLGLKELSIKLGMPQYDLKLYRLCRGVSGTVDNYHILTDQQWLLEVPFLLSDTSSELNGEYNKLNVFGGLFQF